MIKEVATPFLCDFKCVAKLSAKYREVNVQSKLHLSIYISYDALVNKFDILERMFKLD